ncbi:cytochrome P450 [Aspergillus floccosus]
MAMPAILFDYPFAFLGIASLIFLSVYRWIQHYQPRVKVPIVGGEGVYESWKAARRWRRCAPRLLQEGYKAVNDFSFLFTLNRQLTVLQHKNFAFQVATPSGWDVCICNDAMIREYLNAPDEYLSSVAPIQGFFQSKYTAPGLFHKIPSSAMSKALAWSRTRTRSTDEYFPSFIEEIEYSFEQEVGSKLKTRDGWNKFDCFTISRRLIMGLVAKLLIGDECRNPASIDLFCDYTAEMLAGGPYIRSFPDFLKPDLTDWFWRWSQQEPKNNLTELDIAQLLAANTFGASFNTTVVLVQCLCELATRPEYVDALREEIVSTLRSHNNTWTKDGIDSMNKLDSFIKETHRYNCFDYAGTPRVVKKGFQFKNGLWIPKGTVLFTPNAPMLLDKEYIQDPHVFDGFRFYDLARDSKTPEAFKYTSTNPHYLQFGDGKHVCPGRFFAADELRLILAYLLFHFEIKLQESLPENFKITRNNLSDLRVNILLKPI